MGRSKENKGFMCAYCETQVLPLTNGSYRNHCPFCLWSLHVDIRPGDRASNCNGLMRPTGIRRAGKRLQLVHRCERCGETRVNRIAEDSIQADDFGLLIELMQIAYEE